MFTKLYKRGEAWVGLSEGRFVVIADWYGQERVVYTSVSSSLESDRQEDECVRYCAQI